ncbi:hypothetical protein ACFVYP_33320, partial [Kitasatospora sp. NPDC058201]|uniref:hypothetical protein n=1 Tax=Kitasatospora sp. NPDC058201 TaxID=3346379 RepID=UPI0036DE53C0
MWAGAQLRRAGPGWWRALVGTAAGTAGCGRTWQKARTTTLGEGVAVRAWLGAADRPRGGGG